MLQRLEVEKMGQILCVKKVPFRKSGHKYSLKDDLMVFQPLTIISLLMYCYKSYINFEALLRCSLNKLNMYYNNFIPLTL